MTANEKRPDTAFKCNVEITIDVAAILGVFFVVPGFCWCPALVLEALYG